jgi:endoglucanase
MNLGNTLDWRPGAAHRFHYSPEHFDVVAAAGFNAVRLPVWWSGHAALDAPYRIDADFLRLVDVAVGHALTRSLDVVLNVHHYDELIDDVSGHTERFLALWNQIAIHYADYPLRLRFELLNEPRSPMTAAEWNRLLRRANNVIRSSNPLRDVLVGPVSMNTIEALSDLELPDDRHLVATIHYYDPFQFTHQGAPWLVGADRWLGTRWGNDDDRRAVESGLIEAALWARRRDVPLVISEFGSIERADLRSRADWTTTVRTVAERLDIGWCYWDYATDFGVYGAATAAWCQPLLAALIDRPPDPQTLPEAAQPMHSTAPNHATE